MNEQDTVLEFPAYWMRSGPLALWTTKGQMRVGGGRISFKTRKQTIFDEPLEGLSDVVFPRYNIGTVIKFRLAGKRYRITFEKMNYVLLNVDGTQMVTGGSNLRQAREIGAQLKERLGDS